VTVENRDIARALSELADLLEIEGANEFRVRAYRSAARTVEGTGEALKRMVERGEDLSTLNDIGESIAGKIEEFVRTGSLRQLQELRSRFEGDVTELLDVQEVGPARAGTLYQELGVSDAQSLLHAAQEGRIAELDGFGKKSEQNLQREAERELSRPDRGRMLLSEADEAVIPLRDYLLSGDGVERVEVAGSYRRRKESVGDIDIIAVCNDHVGVMERFTSYDRVASVKSRGDTRSTVVLVTGLSVDLRVVDAKSFGSALYYFTGSKEHNVALRRRAGEHELKINEYGVFHGEERVAGEDEESILASVGLPFIPPVLRENRGEIEAAEQGRLPELVTLEDIRGDLHMHTTATDGRESVSAMAAAAAELGYEYIAITDHSQRVTMAGGLSDDETRQQIDLIAEANESASIEVLSGIEVDILEDGSLDLEEETLEQLDVVVASVHYQTDISASAMTDRLLAALDRGSITILGHPTGRLIGSREAFAFDQAKVFRRAAENGIALEINANPERLDLSDTMARSAVESGARLCISTDAHSIGGLRAMRFGVDTARRGWVTPNVVINTLPLRRLRKTLVR
jgi:DNA polymerase (family X)